jgi:D-amino peptidase
MILGHYGIPIVMVTGDDAACREAKDFLGEQVTTVSVKKGYNRESCLMLAPTVAHDLIRAGAKEALGRIKQCPPFKMELPIRARFESLAERLPNTASPALVESAPRRVVEKVFPEQVGITDFS